MWEEGRCQLYFADYSHSRDLALHAPQQILGEDRPQGCSTVRIVLIAMVWAFMRDIEHWEGVVPKGVVWIVVIPMASLFMCHTKCLGKIVPNGVVWIVAIAMAWTFMWSNDCRNTIIDVI
jgi:hypothetical protein